MCEDLNDKIEDIYPVDQQACLDALKKLAVAPGMPYAPIYTLRLLTVAFFRDNSDAAKVADEELDQMYSVAEDKSDEIVEGQHESSEPEFSEDDFTKGPTIIDVNVGPERPMRSCIIHPDEILGPEKVRCD